MKIGFFDSGMGGLFMMQACIKAHPNDSYIYIGDTQNLPYGPKSSEDILVYMAPYLLWLIEEKKCEYVVVACNTASSQALSEFIKKYPEYEEKMINIVTITQKYLSEHVPMTKKILVLATQRTVQSLAYAHIEHHSVQQLAMPGLVDLIELNDREGAYRMIKDALSYYSDINYLVLGCTHYVYLEEMLKEYYPKIEVLGQDIVLIKYLQNTIKKLITEKESESTQEYFVSANVDKYVLQFELPVQKINVKKN